MDPNVPNQSAQPTPPPTPVSPQQPVTPSVEPSAAQSPTPTPIKPQPITATPGGTPPGAGKMKGLIIKIVVVFVILIVLFVIGSLWAANSSKPATTAVPAPTTPPVSTESSGGVPAVKETDLAPGLPNNQKTAVTVRNPDSTEEKFIMQNDTVEAYINALPPGVTFVSVTPLQ